MRESVRSPRTLLTAAKVRDGWIRYIRQAMLMTLSTLAKTAGLTKATVQQIEKREVTGKVTLETMRKIAAAMECEFVYAIVPKQELSEFLKKKATLKATRIVRDADVHMTLEDQQVTEQIKERIEQ